MYENAKFYVHSYEINAEEMAEDFCLSHGTNFEIDFCEDGVVITYEELEIEKKLPRRMKDGKAETRNA